MHCHHFTEYQPSLQLLTIYILQLNRLRHSALKRNRTFSNSRCCNQARCHRGQASKFKFTDFRCKRRTRLVHRLRQRACHQVPDKLASLFDVANRILVTNAGETDDGWNVIKRSEKAIGRCIEHAICVAGRDPANRTWSDDGVEWVMGQPMSLARFVVVSRIGHGGGESDHSKVVRAIKFAANGGWAWAKWSSSRTSSRAISCWASKASRTC